MKKIFIRELKEYSKEYILELMKKDSFNKLLEYEIIKREDNIFKFNFVGVIIVDNYIINCYPKYIPNEDNIEDDFAQIIRVIKKYKNMNDEFSWENENLEDTSFNKLSMRIFFLEDYYQNGIYTKIQNIREINGNGEIDWNRTINNIDPIINDNKPYYGELYTKYKINDLYDYFRLLHEYIITECSKILEEAGLIELFDLTPIELSDKSLFDFGEKETILEKLEKQLKVEFNSHKQKLLKSMHAYISSKNSFTNEDFLTIYGTSTYHVIWEEMCRRVFGNKLNKLKNVIKKPVWHLKEGNFEVDTFRPDLITFWRDYFVILDAKYYKLKITSKLERQPGLSDVTKQYLYQLAFRDFIEENEFIGVKNAFLLPKYAGEVENSGYVEIGILHDLDLENIQVVMLPAGKINKLYLDNKKMSIASLNL